MNEKITIVTGASSNHYQCMVNLLWSISKFSANVNVIVYDLGLTQIENDLLVKLPPFHLANYQVRNFDYSKYPDYFNVSVNSGRMGFRPVGIQAAAKEFGGIVIWLDAGCLLTQSLTEFVNYVKKNGIYCHRTSGIIATELYPNARRSLGVTEDILSKQLRDAGICAFDTTNDKAMTLINKWVNTALNKDSTAPIDSSRRNHRQDAVFTVLYEQSGIILNNWRTASIKMRQDIWPLAEVKRRHEKWRY